MDTAKKWTEENPIGTVVCLNGCNIPHKVASHAFWPPMTGPLVLLDNGGCVDIDAITRMVPNAQSSPTGTGDRL